MSKEATDSREATMFSINEWLERYEVNDKGQPAKTGDKLRVRPLDYIRSKIHGRDEGAGFHAMRCIAKSRTWEVFGIFQKFLEIAGDSGADDRGKLLNQQGKPATISDLAHILRTTEAKITYSLRILTDPSVNWIKISKIAQDSNNTDLQEFQENQESETQRRAREGDMKTGLLGVKTTIKSDEKECFPEIPGIPGKSGALYNETEGKGTEGNRIKDKENSARAEFATLFWPNVPNKIGKGKARDAYLKARKNFSAEAILAGLPKYQAYEDGRKSQIDYRPLLPTTWLNQERWDDEVVKAKTTMDKINEMKKKGDL